MVRRDELGATVSGEHVNDCNLTPLVDVHQQTAQLAVVLVNQIDSLRTDLFKRLNGASRNKLKRKKRKLNERSQSFAKLYNYTNSCLIGKQLFYDFHQLIFLFRIDAKNTIQNIEHVHGYINTVEIYLYSLGIA